MSYANLPLFSGGEFMRPWPTAVLVCNCLRPCLYGCDCSATSIGWRSLGLHRGLASNTEIAIRNELFGKTAQHTRSVVVYPARCIGRQYRMALPMLGLQH
jgi:hypothetical protein